MCRRSWVAQQQPLLLGMLRGQSSLDIGCAATWQSSLQRRAQRQHVGDARVMARPQGRVLYVLDLDRSQPLNTRLTTGITTHVINATDSAVVTSDRAGSGHPAMSSPTV
jgi:hypothetical protein